MKFGSAIPDSKDLDSGIPQAKFSLLPYSGPPYVVRKFRFELFSRINEYFTPERVFYSTRADVISGICVDFYFIYRRPEGSGQ